MPCQVEEGRCSSGATRGGVTGGVTHAMSGGGGEVQQWWRVGPHRVVSQLGGVTHAMSGGGGEVQQWWRVGPHGVVSQEV